MADSVFEADPARSRALEADPLEVAAALPPDREAMPLPSDARTVFLGGLFFLAAMGALYVASAIVLPVILAIMLKLLLQPLVRLFDRVRLPRVLGALVALLLLLGVLAGLAAALTRPAADWGSKLPRAVPRLTERLHALGQPLEAFRRTLDQVEGVATTATPAPDAAGVPVRPSGLVDTMFSGTRAAATGFCTTMIVLFYLLVSGETFLRRLVEILPRFADKRRAVEISLHLERDVSAYLVTVTLINAVIGVLLTAIMWAGGVSDPPLWGFIAFLLNYVPILGPLVGLVLFALAGVLDFGPAWSAVLPAVVYYAMHLIESNAVTPMLLARRFTINPVALVLALVFWYWMWGVAGAILAVPMLAITKIICDDLPPLRAFGHFLEA